MPADASEEEVRKVRVEALRCLIQTILTATIVNVLPGHRIIMSERPPEDLSNNPSQQQPDAEHLAVLRDNLGQVVEVMLPPHLRCCSLCTNWEGCIVGSLLRPICTALPICAGLGAGGRQAVLCCAVLCCAVLCGMNTSSALISCTCTCHAVSLT